VPSGGWPPRTTCATWRATRHWPSETIALLHGLQVDGIPGNYDSTVATISTAGASTSIRARRSSRTSRVIPARGPCQTDVYFIHPVPALSVQPRNPTPRLPLLNHSPSSP
jgi:hypothetical protein